MHDNDEYNCKKKISNIRVIKYLFFSYIFAINIFKFIDA